MRKLVAILVLLAAPAVAQVPTGAYREDSAHADTHYGFFGLVVRKDVAATMCGADGDYCGLQVNANGSLRVDPGTVTITDGSGALTVDGTVAVSGTVTVGSHDVTNAGTFAVQAAQSGTWTVQPGNTANSTAWLVTGTGGTFPVTGTFWQATQPVSGTVTANAGTGTFTVGDGAGALNVIVDSSALPSGASTLGEQQTQTTSLQKLDNIAHAGSDVALSEHVPVSGQLDDTGTTTVTENQVAPVRITAARALNSNLFSLGGTATSVGNGTAGSGSLRVSVANDSTGVLASITTSVTPGTGATNLGKAVDGTPGATDTGVVALSVRDDALATLTPPDGDYTQLRVNSTGALWVKAAATEANTLTDGTDTAQVTTTAGGSLQVECVSGCAGSGGTASVDGAGYVASTTAGTPTMGARDDASVGTLAEDKVGIARMTEYRGLHVNLRDATGAEVSVGGGTQYDEDTVSSAADKVTMAGVVRQDATTSLAGTDGDRTQLQVDAEGRLWVNGSDVTQPVSGTVTVTDGAGALNVIVDSGSITANAGTNLNTSALALESGGNLATVAGAVSGTEMQVDVVGALPAGANAIGKLAANSGVDIGDVDVTTVVPGTGATNLGKAISDVGGATDTGVLGMAIRDDSVAMGTIADGDYSPLRVNSTGSLWVKLDANGGGSVAAVVSDVTTSVTPGTAAANLGKAEDAAHNSADTGVAVLGVRRDTAASSTATDGEYGTLNFDSTGRLWANVSNTVTVSDGSGALNVIVDSSALPSGASTSAEQATQTASLSVLDDWDESDRAKVNPIAGQAGVQGGAGAVTALTQRVALATDANTVKVSDGTDTALVSGSGALNVTCDNCGGSTVEDEDAFTVGTSTVNAQGYLVDETTPDSAPEDSLSAPRMALNRVPYAQLRDAAGNERGANVTAGNALVVDGSASTQPVSGTVTVTDGAGALNVIVDSGTVTTVTTLTGTTTLTPGTGATNLGKAISDAAGGTDTGVMALALRDDSVAAGAGVADNDYTPLRVNSTGSLWVAFDANGGGTANSNVTNVTPGTTATALGKAEDAAHSSGDVGVQALVVRSDAGGTIATSDGEYSPLQVDANGALRVTGGGGGTEYTEGATDATITGSAILWEDAGDTLTPVSAAKPLPVSGTVTANLSATDNAVLDDIADGIAVTATDLDIRNLTATDVVTVTDGAGALNVIVDSGSVTVAGAAADGAAVSGNPVRIAGKDGSGNTQDVVTDTSGELQVDVLTLPNVTIGTFPDNEPINVAQMNGVAVTMGNGAAGTGVQRVTIASDSTGTVAVTQATASNLNVRPDTSGATGAAPPARANFIGGIGSGATGGLVVGITVCDSHAPIDIVTATTTLAITGVSGRQVRICAINLVSAGANNVALISGTGATCGTSTAGINGGTTAAEGWNLAANGGIAQGSGFGEIMRSTDAGDSVCVVTSAAVQLAGSISYAIY